MKIDFITEKSSGDWDGELEYREVKVNNKTYLSQGEGFEPEDALFCRSLQDPFDVQELIDEVIAAVKRGESIEYCYQVVEEL